MWSHFWTRFSKYNKFWITAVYLVAIAVARHYGLLPDAVANTVVLDLVTPLLVYAIPNGKG